MHQAHLSQMVHPGAKKRARVSRFVLPNPQDAKSASNSILKAAAMAALTAGGAPGGGDTASSRDQKQYGADDNRQYGSTDARIGGAPPSDLMESAHSRPTLKFVYSAQVTVVEWLPTT